MKRITATLAALAITAGLAIISGSTADAASRVRLVTTADRLMPCASMNRDAPMWRGRPVDWQPADVIFKVKLGETWTTVYQAPDGLQFVAVPVGQFPYFACAPTPNHTEIPASWVEG